MAYHILPENDEREHEKAQTCWCKPRVVLEYTEDDGVRYRYVEPLVIHHAEDCREVVENLIGEQMAEEKTWRMQQE